MPGSFLARHRTICAVIDEIRGLANENKHGNNDRIVVLCDEAKQYAQSMSNKLLEYKLADQLTITIKKEKLK